MNNNLEKIRKEFKKFNANSIYSVICGVTLLKINNKEPRSLSSKRKFLTLVTTEINHSKFKLLTNLERWISFSVNRLNEEIFFDIYNTVNKYPADQLMDYFNQFFSEKSNRHNAGYNESLSKLAITITAINKNDTFLDPTATLNGAWLDIIKNNSYKKMFLQTIQPLEACWIYLTIKAFKRKNVEITSANALIEPKYVIDDNQLEQFDRIITISPFGMKAPTDSIPNTYNRFIYGSISKTDTELGFISNVISSLNDSGRATIIVPNKPLSSVGKKRKAIRNNIINSDKIEAVISFPERFFSNTSVPTNLLVINSNKKLLKNKILFIDANQANWIQRSKTINSLNSEGIHQILELLQHPKSKTNISRKIDISKSLSTLMAVQYITKDYVFINNQKYHINNAELKKVAKRPLKDVASVLPGYNMTNTDNAADSDFKILRISDLTEKGSIDFENLSNVKNTEKDNLNKYLIQKNDILFSVRGTLGKTIFIEEEPPVKTIINSNLVIIRCKDITTVNPRWLHLYLNSLLVKYFVEKDKSGAVISVLSLKHLKDIPVIEKAQYQQTKVVQSYDFQIRDILELQKQIKSKKESLQSNLNHDFSIDKIFKEI